jgi:hypothetical protein
MDTYVEGTLDHCPFFFLSFVLFLLEVCSLISFIRNRDKPRLIFSLLTTTPEFVGEPPAVTHTVKPFYFLTVRLKFF